jgi:hypothetical protein
MKVLSCFALLPALVLSNDWVLDPRCPGYNDRRNLRDPASQPKSDKPVQSSAFGDEEMRVQLQERALQEYGDLPTFQLKMYWEPGFCWQGEWEDRVYCMDCDTRTCNEGGILELQFCSYESEDDDVRDQRLQWIPTAEDVTVGRIKAASGNLCMERIENKNYELRECNLDSVRQLLIGFSYTDPFEILAQYDNTRCLNQQHDPKIYETIELTECSVARRVNTNRWEVIELDGDIPPEFLVSDEEDDPETEGDGPGIGFTPCFPSDTTVFEKSRGHIPLSDLQVGDEILGLNDTFSQVYAFGHKAPHINKVPYLEVETSGTGNNLLSISEHHMLFLSNGQAVAASTLKVGDELLGQQDRKRRVTSITKSFKKGAMAPFTVDGAFLVNSNFVVSSYVDVGLSHDLVHKVLPPLLSAMMREERYDEEGLNVWLPSFDSAVRMVRYGKLMCSFGVAAWLAWRVRSGAGSTKAL